MPLNSDKLSTTVPAIVPPVTRARTICAITDGPAAVIASAIVIEITPVRFMSGVTPSLGSARRCECAAALWSLIGQPPVVELYALVQRELGMSNKNSSAVQY